MQLLARLLPLDLTAKIRLRRLVQDGRGEPEPPLVIEPAEPEPETATEPEAEPQPISNVGVFTPSRKERS